MAVWFPFGRLGSLGAPGPPTGPCCVNHRAKALACPHLSVSLLLPTPLQILPGQLVSLGGRGGSLPLRKESLSLAQALEGLFLLQMPLSHLVSLVGEEIISCDREFFMLDHLQIADNCSKRFHLRSYKAHNSTKYCFQKDFIKINSKTQGEEYSKAITSDIFGKMSTHLNETVNSFQITYYILPLCLCFRKTCADTAESKTKG